MSDFLYKMAILDGFVYTYCAIISRVDDKIDRRVKNYLFNRVKCLNFNLLIFKGERTVVKIDRAVVLLEKIDADDDWMSEILRDDERVSYC